MRNPFAVARTHPRATAVAIVVVAALVAAGVWVHHTRKPVHVGDDGLTAGHVYTSPAGVIYIGTNAFDTHSIATQAGQVSVICDKRAAMGGDVLVTTQYWDRFVLYRGQDRLTYVRRVTGKDVAERGAKALPGTVVRVDLTSSNPAQPLVQWMRDGTVHVVAGSELSPEWAANFGNRYTAVPFVWAAFTTRCGSE